jgi:hypothetical protein
VGCEKIENKTGRGTQVAVVILLTLGEIAKPGWRTTSEASKLDFCYCTVCAK